MYSKVVLMGRLSRDPELLYTSNQTAICKVTLAVDTGWGDKKDTAFVDVTLWGKNGESFERFHRKGDRVLVDGELRQEKWEDKNTGQKRSKLVVNGSSWAFAQDKKTKDTGGGSSPWTDDDPFA